MKQKIADLREYLDKMLVNGDFSVLNLDTYESEIKQYAWAPTLFCVGELGTTDDLSSRCAPSRCGCSNKDAGELSDLEQPEVPEVPKGPRFGQSQFLQNPF